MPSTYSPNLRLELPATGEQSLLWGQTINKNIGTLLEQAISGTITIAALGTPGSQRVLTTLNGAADESRYAAIDYRNLAVANTLIIPNVQKLYVIRNNTAATNTAGILTVSTAGVPVASVIINPGSTAYVLCDGALSVVEVGQKANTTFTGVTTAATLNVTGNETVGGTLGVTGATTLASVGVTGAATVGTTLAVTGVTSLNGGATAPTLAQTSNDTNLATTAFAHAAVAAAIGTFSGAVTGISTFSIAGPATVTPPANTKSYLAFILGGGGGGGGGGGYAGGVALGGVGGGFTIATLTGTTALGPINYTVGAGGAGGTALANGAAGGASIFNGVSSAGRGAFTNAIPNGITMTPGAGGNGRTPGAVFDNSGGSTIFSNGVGAAAPYVDSATGGTATGPGCGGGGGASGVSGGGGTGGAGAAGQIVVIWFA